MPDIEPRFVKLTKSEARKLNNLLRERHGNIKACSTATKLSVITLKRAKSGLEITPRSAEIIRENLLSEQLETV